MYTLPIKTIITDPKLRSIYSADQIQISIDCLRKQIEEGKGCSDTRQVEGTLITAETCLYSNMDTVELSERGIALAPKREKPVYVRPDRYMGELPENVVDNTKGYREFMRAYYLNRGYVDEGGGNFSKKTNAPKFDPYNPSSMEVHHTYHDFFEEDTDFFLEAAYEYAKIDKDQEYLYRPTQDSRFVKSTLSWLYGNDTTKQDIDNMHSQIDAIVRELAEQIKMGREPDFGSLTHQFNFRGYEVSAEALIKTQKVTYKLLDAAGYGEWGTGVSGLDNWCERGVVQSVSLHYFQDIMGESGIPFQQAFERYLAPKIEECWQGESGRGSGKWHPGFRSEII